MVAEMTAALREERTRKRKARKVARRILCEAAEDMEIGLIELARRLKAKDADAWAAVAAAKADLVQSGPGEPDWESILAMILAIIELLVSLFG